MVDDSQSPSEAPAVPRWTPSPADVIEALAAYRHGAFPMAMPEQAGQRPDYAFYVSDPRAVLPLDRLRVSRSLRGRVRSGRFAVTSDRAFDEVVFACQHVPRRPPENASGDDQGASGSWISDDLRAVLAELHRLGHAHSVEAWLPDAADAGRRGPVEPPTGHRLVGGIYGLAIGGVFCGESMFSRPALGGSDASKVCLVHLVAHLRAGGFALLDVQILSPFTARLGARDIARAEYLRRLGGERDRELAWRPDALDRRRGSEALGILAVG